jgi:hypothetical protein
VAEQLLEGVHGGTGISVTLGKGVPERVREHLVAGKGQQAAVGAAVGPVQVGQRRDPGPHRALQVGSRQGLGAVGVGQGPREQREPVGRRVGKRCPYPGLLCGDDGRLPVVDRQPATVFADLGHVMHEHRAGSALPVLVDVFVVVQTLEAQRAQLAGAPPDTGSELDGRPHARPGLLLQALQVVRVEQLADHRLRQGTADLVVTAQPAGTFRAAQHHIGRQRGEYATGLGQTHLPAVA